jgi:hypothetical protein
MPWFFIIKAFKVPLALFLKILFFALSLLKDFAVLLVYGVEISFFLLFEVAVLPRVFLLFSAKIIV